MKKTVFYLSLMLLSLAAAGCQSTTAAVAETKETVAERAAETATETTPGTTTETTAGAAAESSESTISGIHHAEIEIEGYGTIAVELDADQAPISVENFISLAESGFYDGLTFHRIIDGFMIQGGDPLGTGQGGSDKKIKGEFTANGVENNIQHTRGTLSMARSQSPDSASSQFFIMHQDSPHLDGSYAAFGHVTSGIEIVDEICSRTPVTDRNGTVSAADQPVIVTIKIID